MIRPTAIPALLLALACATGASAHATGGVSVSPARAPIRYLTWPALVGGARLIAANYGVVTSTFRSVEHNRAVGGVPNSYHLQGRAIDIARRPGVDHAQIDTALRRAGFILIESLDEGDHSHFAFAGTGMPVPSIATTSPAAVTPAAANPAAPPLPIHRLTADEHGTLEVVNVATGGVTGRAGDRLTR